MAESVLDVGILAEHSRKADWGPGKVVKVRPPYVWVFFRDAPGRVARQFPESLLVRSSLQTDIILDNLPAFIEHDGVQLLPNERYTLREALAILHEHAPEGFAAGGSGKAQKDRERRRAAHTEYARTLGAGQAEELLAADEVSELSTRMLQVLSLSRSTSSSDAAAFRAGLGDEERARAYFAALLPYLAADPSEESFAAYAAAATALRGAVTVGTVWPALTLLPFLAQPDRHMLLQPTVTCPAAQRLGFQLPYQATPSWATYDALCRLGHAYLAALAPAGASDLIDVHFFMSALVAKPARPAAS